MLSVYVVCWLFLQTFQTHFCIQANSVDPDQTAPRSQADDKADDNLRVKSHPEDLTIWTEFQIWHFSGKIQITANDIIKSYFYYYYYFFFFFFFFTVLG